MTALTLLVVTIGYLIVGFLKIAYVICAGVTGFYLSKRQYKTTLIYLMTVFVLIFCETVINMQAGFLLEKLRADILLSPY